MKIKAFISAITRAAVKKYDGRGVICLLLLISLAPAMALAQDSILTHIDDPTLMEALESQGYSLSDLLIAEKMIANADLLSRSDAQGFKVIAKTLKQDEDELLAQLKAHHIPYTKKVKNYEARIFDMNWLASPFAMFHLVGVINRIDRQDFAACGETRLIYRLGYSIQDMASMLPFTLNAVYENPVGADGKCAAEIKKWKNPPPGKSDDFIKWLEDGPLKLASLQPKQLEVNLQILRIPSESANDFGGQASYVMRVYEWTKPALDKSVLKIRKLENSPDVQKIKSNPKLRSELLGWIKNNLSAIDLGTFLIPEKFLAEKLFSVSTFGSFRIENRLFEQIFKAPDFGSMNFDEAVYLNSNAAVIERLNSTTCVGCHQNGSVAGFHFLGQDRKETHHFNRILSGFSPHFYAEITRRKNYYSQEMLDQVANKLRPLPAAPANGIAETGMPCTLPVAENDLKHAIHCRPKTLDESKNVSCERVVGNRDVQDFFGVCLEESNQVPSGGVQCLVGEIEDKNGIFGSRFDIKQILYSSQTSDNSVVNDRSPLCQLPISGVPGGLELRSCTAEREAFEEFKPGQPLPTEICGMRAGKRFDECASTGVFAACLSSSTARGSRTTCTRKLGCRPDYICQRFPDEILGNKKDLMQKVGFCTPTYFIFQLRLDGHPDPLAGTKGSILETEYGGAWK